jgi:hypothetical protein
MTKKLDPVEIDAMSCINHAAIAGVPLEEYTDKVARYARKRVRMICKGLKTDD